MPGNLSSQAIHGCVMCETELPLEERTVHAMHCMAGFVFQSGLPEEARAVICDKDML